MVTAQPVVHTEYERMEPHVEDVSLVEVKIAIFGLTIFKAPSNDDILAELIKYGGEELHVQVIFKLCRLIRVQEQVPDSWNEAIIIIALKEDTTKCDNYELLPLQ